MAENVVVEATPTPLDEDDEDDDQDDIANPDPIYEEDDEDADRVHPVDDDEDELEEAEVVLERLPRPVNELNCRQARSYLVRLLRAANGNQNPAYGNPKKRPPFWPDSYWPWERLTDVHTKPRGMTEPLQYSEMMKLAISRGYQYYGYDPNEYIDPNKEELERKSGGYAAPVATPIGSVNPHPPKAPQARWALETSDGTPPKLPRPLSKLNCVQARTVLSRLLRYQQGGNNPVYGSPSTRPPWWPDEYIRWVDIVDLRGKPPYLPDQKSYSDVLKHAIGNGLRHYGLDPETYVEDDDQQQPAGGVPALARKPPPAAASFVSAAALPAPALKETPSVLTIQGAAVVQPVSFVSPSSRPAIPSTAPIVPTTLGSTVLTTLGSLSPTPQLSSSSGSSENIITVTKTDPKPLLPFSFPLKEDPLKGEPGMPPYLARPISEMRCGHIRVALSKLLWFYNNGSPPNYGSALSMPIWWPDHLMQWTKIKNLSAAYPGKLANTYTNCLRIALIRGYAHYGLDPNDYVVREADNGDNSVPGAHGMHDALMDDSEDEEDNVVTVSAVEPPVVKLPPNLLPLPLEVALPQEPNPSVRASPYRPLPKSVAERLKRRQCPDLLPIRTDPGWFPDKVTSTRVSASLEDLRDLKQCKVLMDKSVPETVKRLRKCHVRGRAPPTLLTNDRTESVCEMFSGDRKKADRRSRCTDMYLISSDKREIPVHRVVLAAHSPLLKSLLREDKDDSEASITFPDIDSAVLEALVEALYTGTVLVQSAQMSTFNKGLKLFQTMGLLKCLVPSTILNKPSSTDDSNDDLMATKESEGAEQRLNEKPEDLEEVKGTDSVEVERVKDITGGDSLEIEVIMTSSSAPIDESKPENKQKQEVKDEEDNDDEVQIERVVEKKDNSKPETKVKSTEIVNVEESNILVLEPESPKTRRSLRRNRENTSHEDKNTTPPRASPASKSEGRKRGRPCREAPDSSPSKSKFTSASSPPCAKRSRRIGRTANRPVFDNLTHEALNEALDASTSNGDAGRSFIEWLTSRKLLLKPTPCSYCSEDLRLKEDSKAVDKLVWSCPNEAKKGNHASGVSPRANSVFEKWSDDSLSWIVKVLICWKSSTSISECVEATGAEADKIFRWYNYCSKYFAS